jgi:protein arginine kinase
MSWFFSKSNDADIVLTSRVRLARNIDNIPFPHMMSKEQSNKIIENISSSILDSNSFIANEFRLVRLENLNYLDRISMVEKHLISKDLAGNHEIAAVLLNRDENVSIMINEEDHIRLQVIYPGMNLKEAYDYATKIDDLIEERVTYSYDSRLGYLTSCPTNVGTGIRASVMVHLPALTISRNIDNIVKTVTQVGMTIRGLYGEGSNVMGNIYQVSNQVTLGFTEEEIINNLIAVTTKIIDQEKRMRQFLMEKQLVDIEDSVYRALGILKYARKLETSESLNLISRIRMGLEMGIIKDINVKNLNELLVNVQPATLQLIEGRELSEKERDVTRARIVRETLR